MNELWVPCIYFFFMYYHFLCIPLTVWLIQLVFVILLFNFQNILVILHN